MIRSSASLASCALLLGLVAAAGACNGLLGNEAIVFDDPALDASADEAAVDSSVDVEPSDGACSGAACPRIVFVTSLSFQGALGGLDGADAFCNQAAAEPGSLVRGRTFVAWLSDSLTFASSRLVHGTMSYRRTDGRVVAASWDQLVSGTLAAPIDRDERGALRMPAPPDVWTGTEATGSRRVPNCNEWQTSSPETLGTTGTWASADATWSANLLEHLCSTPAALYCIER